MRKVIYLVLTAAVVVVSLALVVMEETETAVSVSYLDTDSIQNFMEDYSLSSMCMDKGHIYVGTDKGVVLFDKSKGEVVMTISDDVTMVYSSEMLITDDGLLWVGHDEGLLIMDVQPIRAVYEQLQNDQAVSLKAKVLANLSAPDLPEGRCNALAALDDYVVAGFQEGAAVLKASDPGQSGIEILGCLTTDDGLAEPVVQDILIHKEQVWLGSYLGRSSGGVSVLPMSDVMSEIRNFSYITHEEGLPHGYINSMVEIQYGGSKYVLAGTGHLDAGGLAVIDSDEKIVKSLDEANGIPGMKVRYVHVSKETGDRQRVIITTELDGILLTDLESLMEDQNLKGVVMNTETGLSHNEVKVVAEDQAAFWLGCKRGLSRLDKGALDDLK